MQRVSPLDENRRAIGRFQSIYGNVGNHVPNVSALEDQNCRQHRCNNLKYRNIAVSSSCLLVHFRLCLQCLCVVLLLVSLVYNCLLYFGTGQC